MNEKYTLQKRVLLTCVSKISYWAVASYKIQEGILEVKTNAQGQIILVLNNSRVLANLTTSSNILTDCVTDLVRSLNKVIRISPNSVSWNINVPTLTKTTHVSNVSGDQFGLLVSAERIDCDIVMKDSGIPGEEDIFIHIK